MSLPDQLERAGVVLGSILMLSLPSSLLLAAVTGATTPWWGPAVLLGPGFVVGWAVAAGQTPFDYDDVWFVCFFGYVAAMAAMAVLEVDSAAEGGTALAVGAASFAAAAVVDYYR